MKVLHRILVIAIRECRHLIKNPIYVMCMVVAPALVTLFFTDMMVEGQPEDMPVGVVDNDNTSMTRKLTRTLDSFQSSKVVARYPSVADARHAMQKGEIYAFMYFPKGTTDALLSSRQPKVSFYYSNTSLTAGSLLYKDLKTMCTLGSAAVGQATLQAKGFTPEQIKTLIQPIAVDSHNIGNPWISYNIYLSTMLVPGCLLLFVFLITVYSFGSEIKFGKNKKLMRLAGDNLFVAIIGKLIPQTCIFLMVIFASLTYMFGILQFPSPGGTWPLLLLGLLSILGSQGFALFIFSLIPTLRMALSVCSLWGVLSFSMVGSAFPVFAMDKPLEMLSYLFPLRHYYIIYQLCVFNDYPLSDAWLNILILIIFFFMPWIFYKRLGNAMRNYVYMK